MDSSYWHNKWKSGDTHFHQSSVHPQLVKNFDRFGSGKVLVPLCGKSLDMLWIKSQDRHVVGVELSPIASEAFFTENKIAFQKRKFEKGVVFESDRITIWCCDFFDLSDTVWSDVACIYDRAALIALPQDIRAKYAIKIGEAGTRVSAMLLITVDYAQEKVQGPPFAVSAMEVTKLYQNNFSDITKLDSHVDESVNEGRSKFDGVDVIEETFLLTR